MSEIAVPFHLAFRDSSASVWQAKIENRTAGAYQGHHIQEMDTMRHVFKLGLTALTIGLLLGGQTACHKSSYRTIRVYEYNDEPTEARSRDDRSNAGYQMVSPGKMTGPGEMAGSADKDDDE